LRLTVLDDVSSGNCWWRAGKRTRAFLGVDDVQCHWGTTVGSMVKLLEKNNFAALDFRLGLALALSGSGILIFAVIVLGLLAGTAAGSPPPSPVDLILPANILARRVVWPWPCAVFVRFMVPRVPLCHGQLDLGDATPGRYPLARHFLFAGNLAARGQCGKPRPLFTERNETKPKGE